MPLAPTPDALLPLALFPGIVTARLAATAQFYLEHFDFRSVQTGDDTTMLARSDGARLALLRAGNLDQPAALQTPTRGSGVWLNLAVDDPESLHARMDAAGVEVVAPPEITRAGTRRFVVRDPNGVLVYVCARPPVASPALLHQLNPDLHDENHRDSVHGLSRH